MEYFEFEWDEGNESKVRLRASPEEVESAFFDPNKKIYKTFFNRYQALVRTGSGRYLSVIYQRKARGIIRVISVRDMARKERRRYSRK